MLAIPAVLGPSLTNSIVAAGIVFTPVFARLVRAHRSRRVRARRPAAVATVRRLLDVN